MGRHAAAARGLSRGVVAASPAQDFRVLRGTRPRHNAVVPCSQVHNASTAPQQASRKVVLEITLHFALSTLVYKSTSRVRCHAGHYFQSYYGYTQAYCVYYFTEMALKLTKATPHWPMPLT